MREQSAYNRAQHIERITRAISLSLFEVIVGLSHSISDMGQT